MKNIKEIIMAFLAALAIMLIGTAFVVADTLIRNHVHQHHHFFHIRTMERHIS